jgi:hypothetical protein
MKKTVNLLLTLVMFVTIVGCSATQEAAPESNPAASADYSMDVSEGWTSQETVEGSITYTSPTGESLTISIQDSNGATLEQVAVAYKNNIEMISDDVVETDITFLSEPAKKLTYSIVMFQSYSIVYVDTEKMVIISVLSLSDNFDAQNAMLDTFELN